MTGSSLLPVSIYKNKLYFLFGKENEMEDSAPGFSDFGGGVETGESVYKTALREGGEEFTGFLGDAEDLKKHIDEHGGFLKIVHNDYHIHLFFLPYDMNLTKYYNSNHRFLWKRMNQTTLNDSKLFEKSQIEWFDISSMTSRIKEFRSFYQSIVQLLISKQHMIHSFIKKNRLRIERKTRKKRG